MIRLEGVRTDLTHPFMGLMARVVTDETTNEIPFDSIAEMAELRK